MGSALRRGPWLLWLLLLGLAILSVEVTVTATDRAGNSRARHRTARVRSRPPD
jgi:hypothetical protein